MSEHNPFGGHPRATTPEEYEALYKQSLENPRDFWMKEAEALTWFHDPEIVLDADLDEVDFSWFSGGRLNVGFNCVDRHARKTPDKTALIWAKNEPGEYEHITFMQLKHRVGQVANVLKNCGVRRGDRVVLYLPMVPELVYCMLACARLGAVHSVVFAGFSSEALRDRILDAGAKVIVTANEGVRGNKRIALKRIADQAIEGLSVVDKMLVVRRTETDVRMQHGRDLWLDEEMRKQRSTCPYIWTSAEDPLFILYTSGSTGKPKGVLHTTAGYLMYAAMTHRHVFDVKSDDIHLCAADIGWITGHSYIVYGPLANGITSVIFESLPTFPNPSRYWEVIQDLKCTTLYTSPTALRALIREGDKWLDGYDLSSLRVLGSVGEPINPEVYRWYKKHVGGDKLPIVDTWWQTETGGVMITPQPGSVEGEPGSASLPFYGIEPQLVDGEGNVVEGNDVEGNLCITRPWPGQARTIWGDHARYRETYYGVFKRKYFTGDGARRDKNGKYWLTGRVDDVVNVSGHRIGTAEVESALVYHESVAEAAVVPFPHDIKGQGICAYVVLRADSDDNVSMLTGALREQVRHAIGPIATPDQIRVVPGLPKTRSGKIMRRVLRKIASGEGNQLGDLSTLADPKIVEDIMAGEPV